MNEIDRICKKYQVEHPENFIKTIEEKIGTKLEIYEQTPVDRLMNILNGINNISGKIFYLETFLKYLWERPSEKKARLMNIFYSFARNELDDYRKIKYEQNKNLLRDDIPDEKKSAKDQNLNQHITWYNSDSLRPFIEALKEHDLIESRETELIIQEHFEPQRDQNSKPKPIQWLDDNQYVAYLFHRLIEEGYITVQRSKQKLLASHFISQYGKALNPASLSSLLSTLLKSSRTKDRTIKKIEKIIRELPDSNY